MLGYGKVSGNLLNVGGQRFSSVNVRNETATVKRFFSFLCWKLQQGTPTCKNTKNNNINVNTQYILFGNDTNWTSKRCDQQSVFLCPDWFTLAVRGDLRPRAQTWHSPLGRAQGGASSPTSFGWRPTGICPRGREPSCRGLTLPPSSSKKSLSVSVAVCATAD